MKVKLTLWGSDGLYDKEVIGVQRLVKDNSADVWLYLHDDLQQYDEGELEHMEVFD